MAEHNNFELEFKEDLAPAIATSPKNSERQIVMGPDPPMFILTISFKILAVTFYYVLKFGLQAEIATFVVVVLLDCFDFWVTKNVTGRYLIVSLRKLVGLRWWSEFNEQGE